jgi:hypothetical protein
VTPLDQCWQCIADAEVEHDAEHAARALAALALLTQRSGDAVEDQPAQGQRH